MSEKNEIWLFLGGVNYEGEGVISAHSSEEKARAAQVVHEAGVKAYKAEYNPIAVSTNIYYCDYDYYEIESVTVDD